MKKIMIVLMALVSAAVVVRTAGAQTFPSRPVKLAVPFPAGGGTDLLARVVAEALTKKWGQPVVVENLSGAASGNVGASEVARAAPDGYTLMLSPPGPIAMNKLLYKNMPFDSAAWVPISVVASVPYVLAVRNGLGVSDVKGLIERPRPTRRSPMPRPAPERSAIWRRSSSRRWRASISPRCRIAASRRPSRTSSAATSI